MRIFKGELRSESSQLSNAVSALNGAKRRILIAFLKGQYGRWSGQNGRNERQVRTSSKHLDGSWKYHKSGRL